MRWTIKVLHTIADPLDYNVDVVVELEDGRAFGATFFTLANIERLMARWAETGECASGLYFWSASPIVVKRLDESVIHRTVRALIASGEFESAFELLTAPEPEARTPVLPEA